MSRIWSQVGACARAAREPVSVEHACIASAGALGAFGAGLSMVRSGHQREPVFATDSRSEELGELQFTLGEGPCVDAMNAGEAVLVDDMTLAESELHWPAFAPAAAALGVRGMFSIPAASAAENWPTRLPTPTWCWCWHSISSVVSSHPWTVSSMPTSPTDEQWFIRRWAW